MDCIQLVQNRGTGAGFSECGIESNISLQFGLIVNENKTKYLKCTRTETQLNKLMVDNMHIDQVRSFSYLGTVVNGNNTLEEEITERIAKRNKHSVQIKLFLKVTWCPGNLN